MPHSKHLSWQLLHVRARPLDSLRQSGASAVDVRLWRTLRFSDDYF